MSFFPSGDVAVTPFVGAHDNNKGTVVPPQGLEFFEDVEGDYYDGLQNKDGKDRIAPGSAILRPHQTWGGHDRHRPRNADGGDRRLPPAHAPPRATTMMTTKTTTTTMTTTMRGGLCRGRSWRTPPRRQWTSSWRGGFHSAAVWHPVKRRALIGWREACLDKAVTWEDLAGHHDPCRRRDVEYRRQDSPGSASSDRSGHLA